MGEDRLFGGHGEDLLIGGTTAHDTNKDALDAVMAEWTNRSRSIDIRIDALTNGGGANGSVVLQKGSTVLGDEEEDWRDGGPGVDWLLPFPEDRLIWPWRGDRIG